MDTKKHELIQIISNFTGVNMNLIKLDTLLGADLGIDGDDAYDLLEEISSRFNCNLDKLDFKTYFTPESDINIFKSLFDLIKFGFFMVRNYNHKIDYNNNHKDISIEMLLSFINDKEWNFN